MDRATLIAAMQATAAEAPVAVTVPKWGVVYVRMVTVGEIDEQTDDTDAKNDKNKIARAAARVICDESGQRMFDPASAEDVALLAKQPWPMLRRVLAASNPDDEPGNA